VGVSEECLTSKKLPSNAATLVVYNPIAPELENLASVSQSIQKDTDILFAGRIIEGKGVLVLAEALCHLNQDGKIITVCFAGTGSESGQIAARLEGCKNIRLSFVGRLEYSELGDIYSRSRCLVLPSTTHPEGMPVVIAEAFAFGLPIIGSDQKAIVETIGAAGLIGPQGSAGHLADAMRLLLNDRDLWTRLSAAARQRAHLFSYQGFSQKINHIVSP
jgi:glycosyltransferase involved in cell wall biosynthesis